MIYVLAADTVGDLGLLSRVRLVGPFPDKHHAYVWVDLNHSDEQTAQWLVVKLDNPSIPVVVWKGGQ